MLRTGGTNKWRMSLGMAGSGNEKFSIYDEANTANVLTAEQGGNIGIGTTSPTGKLQVHNDGSGIKVLNENVTGQVFEVYGDNGSLVYG